MSRKWDVRQRDVRENEKERRDKEVKWKNELNLDKERQEIVNGQKKVWKRSC